MKISGSSLGWLCTGSSTLEESDSDDSSGLSFAVSFRYLLCRKGGSDGSSCIQRSLWLLINEFVLMMFVLCRLVLFRDFL